MSVRSIFSKSRTAGYYRRQARLTVSKGDAAGYYNKEGRTMIFLLGALAVSSLIVLLVLALLFGAGLQPVVMGQIILMMIPLILSLCFFIKLYCMSKKIKSLEKKVERLMHNHGSWWLKD